MKNNILINRKGIGIEIQTPTQGKDTIIPNQQQIQSAQNLIAYLQCTYNIAHTNISTSYQAVSNGAYTVPGAHADTSTWGTKIFDQLGVNQSLRRSQPSPDNISRKIEQLQDMSKKPGLNNKDKQSIQKAISYYAGLLKK